MCRPICPFAAAMFGSIGGSAAGAASGVASGWLLYVAYAKMGGSDAQGFAPMLFGTLGMAVGGSAGAVGGMIEGWAWGHGKGPREATAARWGATLAGLWGLNPILWVAFHAEAATAGRLGLAIAGTMLAAGGASGLLGAVASRSVVRSMVLPRLVTPRKPCD